MDISRLDPGKIEAAKRVRLLLLDCDGVLTDGRLYFNESGETLKVFHARDGQGIVDWHKAGFRSGIISGRSSKIVDLRGGQLGVEFIFQGRKEKVSAFQEIVAAAGVDPMETAFVGDDTPDAEVMPFVGFAVAVADAHDAVKRAAHFITERKGGRGAVREVVDLLLFCKQS
ncbi:MAG: HAD hydrolase family protein [Pyrinomonadaceae bacterium]|nr:HAD hydrolase family protein [Blastocatellia bacterium]MCW5956780.1 HAD hydrolase family protein [Pyrinomonadaceae bacterium]